MLIWRRQLDSNQHRAKNTLEGLAIPCDTVTPWRQVAGGAAERG